MTRGRMREARGNDRQKEWKKKGIRMKEERKKTRKRKEKGIRIKEERKKMTTSLLGETNRN